MQTSGIKRKRFLEVHTPSPGYLMAHCKNHAKRDRIIIVYNTIGYAKLSLNETNNYKKKYIKKCKIFHSNMYKK